ncbi:helix-turn-helix domain-containing protein [Pseudoxanthomonas helianthi]|uniref:Helix-turn-helix domain-containing protein n=1 Tax=Pseudoxanthomonas helianthi TaxID=1453541 RepID=A0A941ASQ3_9GAMM|nr:helix-turn-helix domain-containing protein [Pseudoxanthomonas helianthi]MBP3983759.1 helix-turn-helix domain-containing protein [Pseudoxanthomonas helianthi]
MPEHKASGKKPAKLKPIQLKALDFILSGLTLTEVSEKLGVSRQTVSEWKNHNPAFRAKLEELQAEAEEEMRNLLPAYNTFMLSQLRKLAQEAPPTIRLEAIRYFFDRFGQKDEASATTSAAGLSPQDAMILEVMQQRRGREMRSEWERNE